MTPKAFFDAVAAMRLAQIAYVNNRTRETLNAKYDAEKTVDDEIARANEVLTQRNQIPPIPAIKHVQPLTAYEICQYHCTARNCDYKLSRSCDMCQIVYANLKKRQIPVTKDVMQTFE